MNWCEVKRRWTPRRLLLHINLLPASSRTARALAGAVPGLDLDQQLQVLQLQAFERAVWMWQRSHLDPSNREHAEALRALDASKPKPADMHRAPGWVDERGRLRSPAEMERLREQQERELREARDSETGDNEAEAKPTGTAEDLGNFFTKPR